MKITHTSTMQRTPVHPIWLRDMLRVIGAVIGWAILMLSTLLTGFFSGWAFLAVSLLGRAPQEKVITILSVFVVVTIGMAWLVAHFYIRNMVRFLSRPLSSTVSGKRRNRAHNTHAI